MTTEQLTATAGSVVGGYLLGSIPVAWLIAKWHLGLDIRTLGSGNVGVMNTALSVHRWAGLIVLVAEVTKGVVAVMGAALVTGNEIAVGLTAVAAFVGTRWPIWLRFRGGRGNTIGAASIAMISLPTVAVLALLWLVSRRLAASNFVATRVMLVALPPTLGLLTLSWWWGAVGLAYAVLFATTHREETDDHMILRQQWPRVAAFLTAPRRHGHHEALQRRDSPRTPD